MVPEYVQALTIEHAVEALGTSEAAQPLAGGTDLMVQMRLESRTPSLVVDVRGVPDLTLLDADRGVVGGTVTMRRLLQNREIGRSFPALAEAARLLGGRQIQAMATVAGNLCNASPAAETATPLLVHDAIAIIRGPEGERELHLSGLWDGPGSTTLEAGELLTAVRITRAGRSAYRRIALRGSVDVAVVSASVRLEVVDGRVNEARVAIGAAAPTPCRVPAAEAALVGTTVAAPEFEEAIHDASAAAGSAARPIDDIRASARYRTAMVEVLVERASRACLIEQ